MSSKMKRILELKASNIVFWCNFQELHEVIKECNSLKLNEIVTVLCNNGSILYRVVPYIWRKFVGEKVWSVYEQLSDEQKRDYIDLIFRFIDVHSFYCMDANKCQTEGHMDTIYDYEGLRAEVPKLEYIVKLWKDAGYKSYEEVIKGKNKEGKNEQGDSDQ
jgi:hypothetical protein